MKKVGIIMGSDSDLPIVKKATDMLSTLDIPFEVCYDRIKGDSHRPLVANNTKDQLHEIFDKRHDIYLKNSTLTVNADRTPELICDEIISIVGRK